MAHTQVISTTPLRWIDEAGMPRATNDAWHDAAQIVLSHAVPIIAKMQAEPVAVAEQTTAAVRETFKAGTVVHCNRCDKAFQLSRDRQGYPFDKGSASTRLTEFERCPHCETRDTHYVYARDNVAATPAPKVELREFHFNYYSKSDCTGHADITAENREQALSVLWLLDGDYISKVWAD